MEGHPIRESTMFDVLVKRIHEYKRQHLKVLQAAGLVSVDPRGNRRLYLVKREGLEALRQYLDRFWSDALGAYGEEVTRRLKTK